MTKGLFTYSVISFIFLFNTINAKKIEPIEPGIVVFSSNFNNVKDRNLWTSISKNQWVTDSITHNTCLFIDREEFVHTNIDLAPYKGMKLLFTCKAKAENVNKPTRSDLGVKYMLHFKNNNTQLWKNEWDVYGSFNWRTLAFTTIIPKNISQGEILLGFQGCKGKVWFDSITVTIKSIPINVRKSKIKNSLNKHKASLFEKNNIKQKEFTKYRGVMSPQKFRAKEIELLSKDWGANIIRWQLSMNAVEINYIGNDLMKYKFWIQNKLHELDSVLSACSKLNIKVVIDLHSLPGGRIANGTPRILIDKTYRDYYINLWKSIAQRYSTAKFSNENPIWGYDLMNEPKENETHLGFGIDYYQLQLDVAKIIREVDKKTPIIFEVDEADSPLGFKFMQPNDIPNTKYEVHMYSPYEFTHQGINNLKIKPQYPGYIQKTYYDKAKLKEILQPVRLFQLTYNVPIYVGEFSAIRWATGAAQYLDDCISIFEEYGWDWTYLAYKGWNGWDVDYENGTSPNEPAKRAIHDTDRKKVLLKWFAKNKTEIKIGSTSQRENNR